MAIFATATKAHHQRTRTCRVDAPNSILTQVDLTLGSGRHADRWTSNLGASVSYLVGLFLNGTAASSNQERGAKEPRAPSRRLSQTQPS
ncbi:hypothetical protein Ae201684P_017964 [Aphanomyces euteiches]|nr:hypothetical protein Ae201684P_017964 [Aphanomyces euteiches]